MRLAALAVSIVIAASLLWIGAEQHYQSCVVTVQARTAGDATGTLAEFVTPRTAARVKACSRSPF